MVKASGNTESEKVAISAEKRFRQIEAAWEADTMFLSNAQAIIDHPAFQEIIAMGEVVIPFMLGDLEKQAHQWVWALPRLTGVNPVDLKVACDSRKMADAWVRWGRHNGYK